MWLVLQGEKYNNVQLFKFYTMSKTERSSDAIETLKSLIEANEKDNNGNRGKHFPLTDIYNEGWLLRLALSKGLIQQDVLHYKQNERWFSEAELPSPFLQGELNEKRTHADAVIGSYKFEENTATGVEIDKDNFSSFYAIEAKIFAPLSKGIKKWEKKYNQATRYIGCLAYMVYRSGITEFDKLGLIILCPENSKSIKCDDVQLRQLIRTELPKRIEAYMTENQINNDEFFCWWKENQESFLSSVKIEIHRWEEIINNDKNKELFDFYVKCLFYNGKQKEKKRILANYPYLFDNGI